MEEQGAAVGGLGSLSGRKHAALAAGMKHGGRVMPKKQPDYAKAVKESGAALMRMKLERV